MTDFPAHLFNLGGSPEAIAASAQQYQRFGQSAAQASDRITGMDTGQFVGPEGEQFRQKLDSELPPHLRTTGAAFTQVGRALEAFSARLADLQGQMRPLAQQAPVLWEQVKASEGWLHRAQAEDQAHAQEPTRAPAGPPPPPHQSDAGAASASLSAAHQAWQECVGKANALRGEMTAAARECADQIDQAKGMRFQEPPASWDLIGQGRDFFREHKDGLKSVSEGLKYVSAACTVIGLALQAIPVVGNAVGAAFLAVGAVAGVAALGIDAGIYAATGEGSLTSIVVDTALTVLPVGRIAKVGSKLVGGVGDVAKAAKGARGTRQAGDAASHTDDVKSLTTGGDPIDVNSGRVLQSQTDVELGGLLPLVLTRTHLSSYRIGRAFGPSWASTLDQRLEVDDEGVYFASDDAFILAYPHPKPGESALPSLGPKRPLTRTADGEYVITDVEQDRFLHFAGRDGYRPLTAITDHNGHRIEFTYDDTGVPVEVSHSGGYRIRVETTDRRVTALFLREAEGGEDVELMRYRYRAGQLTEVLNASGQPMRFFYDDAGRLSGWRDRTDSWYRFIYDHDGRCVRGEGADGFLSCTLRYDRDRAITYLTNSLGHQTEYHLNDAGQIRREVDPLGSETRYGWDEHRRLVSRTDPLGRTTRYRYDNAGNLAVLIRPDGTEARAEYNALGLPVTVTAPDGTVAHRKYDHAGNLVRSTDPLGESVSYAYDEHGCLTSVTDQLGATRTVETNPAGLPVRITDPRGASTHYERDGFGRITAITDPVGAITRLGWTIDGKPAWRRLPDGATERWLYDGESNLRTHVDPLGQTTQFEATHFELPTAQVRPDGTRLEFGYDTELRLATVTNEQGLVWSYDHDPAGRITAETDFNGRTIRYRHDAAGQLVARTNGAGETTTFTRDLNGQITERHGADSVATFQYDAIGRLVEALNDDARLTFRRDPAGRVLEESINDRTTTSSYDASGRRIRRSTPSGVDSAWDYDENGNPLAVHTAGRTVRFARDPAGREIHRALAPDAVLTQTWDANHQLATQTVTGRAGHRQQHRIFTYRADGLLNGIEDHLAGRRTHSLDSGGRVTRVDGAGRAERYAYDAAGNMTSASWPAEQSSADADTLGEREYSGSLLRRAGTVRYEHDDQGRLVLRQHKRLSAKPATWRYCWDSEDRLVEVITPEGTRCRYRYDALGRRVAKQRLAADGTIAEQVDFIWDGTAVAEERAHRDNGPATSSEAAAVTVWDYEPGTYRPVTQHRRELCHASQDEIDERFYAIVTDQIGTPTELIGEDGDVVWSQRRSLWGSGAEPSSDEPFMPLRFPGQYHDRETGLNYNYHRYYDPDTARYTSADPLGTDGGLQPHSYVTNPATRIDPLGLSPYEAGDTARLESRASQLHEALDPVAQRRRTSAVLGTREGTDVLAGGARDLNPAQRAMAQQGDVLAREPGKHAEVTAVNTARQDNLTPQGIGVSRPICPACQSFLQDSGATITSPTSAWWY